MAKAVLTTKVDPSYDDLPEERYHFPRTYLNAVRQSLHDWIVYYEPRRVSADLSSSGGRQSYFATARIVGIGEDPQRADHYYAYVEDYLEFDRAVPFREGGFYYESGLQKADGSTNKGRFGRSVRLVGDSEYSLILGAGFEAGADEGERFGVREGGSPRHWGAGTRGPADRRVGVAKTVSGPGVCDGYQEGVRRYLRDHRAEDHQWWGAGGGPGGAYSAGG